MKQTSAKYCTLFRKETAFKKWWIAFFLSFKELESVVVLYILICTSFLLWWVNSFHCKSEIMGIFQKSEAMINIMQPNIIILNMKTSYIKGLEVSWHYFIIKKIPHFESFLQSTASPSLILNIDIRKIKSRWWNTLTKKKIALQTIGQPNVGLISSWTSNYYSNVITSIYSQLFIVHNRLSS